MHTNTHRWLATTAGLLFLVSGCARNLTDAEARRLATTYRDEWLTLNGFDSNSVWASTTIVQVQHSRDGWSVIFNARTGTQPEGMHFYSIEVLITPKGKLKKVVHGEAAS
jgi:hypothetical protein